jgi:DNA-binding NarL/FixJ family response regulator
MKTHSHPRRILLVDDHAIVREGFAELINNTADLEVCGQAASAGEAMKSVAKLKPDLVVADLALHDSSGLELIKDIKAHHPAVPVLTLSMHEESLYAPRVLAAGGMGYVMKREPSGTLLKAVRAVLGGDVFVSDTMRDQFLLDRVGGAGRAGRDGVAQLSDRELEIFDMLGEGRTTRQIAEALHLSVSTVETHRAHIKDKLNLANAAELMRAAVEWTRAR